MKSTQYTDNAGNIWDAEVNADTVIRCHQQIGVNLCESADPKERVKLLARLADPIFLITVLGEVLTEQIERAGLSATQFAKAHGGDVLTAANKALTEGVILFFPDERSRVATRALMAKAREGGEIAHKAAAGILDQLTPEMLAEESVAQMQKELDNFLARKSSPESTTTTRPPEGATAS